MSETPQQTWERVACRYCGLCHELYTPCPPLEFPGTEWDQ